MKIAIGDVIYHIPGEFQMYVFLWKNVVTFGRKKIGVVAGTDLNAAQTAEDFGGFRSDRG